MIRRLLDQTWLASDTSIILLALDWAKAFDSISPIGLSKALRRFGIPPLFVDMIDKIYEHRRFIVIDSGVVSDLHSQVFGIL